MKIISIILIFIGLFLCAVGSAGMHFAIHKTIEGAMHAETAGVYSLAQNLETAWYLSIVSVVGCIVIFFGLVLNIISIFTGRKQIT